MINPSEKSLWTENGLTLKLLPFLSILLLTAVVYLPSLSNGFVNWDDPGYVYENTRIRKIDISFLQWIFVSNTGSTWHPLTMFSLALDYHVWGGGATGYHITNLLLHLLNSILVYPITVSIVAAIGLSSGKRSMAGIIAAMLFGVHPLHAESVAWISERKDLLCAFFFLLSVISYISYISGRENTKTAMHYMSTLIFLILSLLSKPMAVTLPVVLMIIDFQKGRGWVKWRLLIEKVPFIILSIAVAVITVLTQEAGGALRTVERYPISTRISVGMESYISYAVKTLLPFNLAPFYPYPSGAGLGTVGFIVALLVFTSITAFCFSMIRSERGFMSAWGYHLITLLPVIGIVKVGAAAAADRYMYLPSIGIFVVMSALTISVYDRAYSKTARVLVISSIVAVLSLFIYKTEGQIRIWRDSVTLWTHQMSLFPNDIFAYIHRGDAFSDKKDYRNAMMDYGRAIGISPGNARARNNRGNLYLLVGKHQEAVEDISRAIEAEPDNAGFYYNRGCAYNGSGEYDKAINDFSRAIELKPAYEKAYNNRARAYSMLGENNKAISDLKESVRINPGYGRAYYNLGMLYLQAGEKEQAILNYTAAADLGVKEAQEALREGK